jgi:NAD(P)-dependent dehydrogenase (short-subunit alcohol dehydrogenase family)
MTPDDKPQTVMVLGANGRFGSAAVLAFACAGWRVIAQSRRGAIKPWPAGVQPLIADALDSRTLLLAGAGADLIVHALNPDYTRWDSLVPPLTAAVVDLAAATGATLMLPGNVYNFGSQLPDRLDETTPLVADTPKARVRIELEAALQAATARGVRSIVIRAGDFLGAAGTWFDLSLARQLARQT